MSVEKNTPSHTLLYLKLECIRAYIFVFLFFIQNSLWLLVRTNVYPQSMLLLFCLLLFSVVPPFQDYSIT